MVIKSTEYNKSFLLKIEKYNFKYYFLRIIKEKKLYIKIYILCIA